MPFRYRHIANGGEKSGMQECGLVSSVLSGTGHAAPPGPAGGRFGRNCPSPASCSIRSVISSFTIILPFIPFQASSFYTTNIFIRPPPYRINFPQNYRTSRANTKQPFREIFLRACRSVFPRVVWLIAKPRRIRIKFPVRRRSLNVGENQFKVTARPTSLPQFFQLC